MLTNNMYKPLQALLRYRRLLRWKSVISRVTIRNGMNVIDVGCGKNGRSVSDYAPANWKITGIDLHEPHEVVHSHANFRYVKCDARDLSQFRDGSFDLCISIGMFEHVVNRSDYMAIANEIERVARQYIVVVPYKYCVIEPHFGVPFLPLMPYSVQVIIIKMLNLSKERQNLVLDPNYLRNNLVWHSNSAYRKIFPSSEIYLLPTLDTIAIVRKD